MLPKITEHGHFSMMGSYTSDDHKELILVINDHPLVLDSLKNLLEAHQYRVQSIKKGGVAIESAKDILPDIILLDTQLPDISGFETCQQLKAGEGTRYIPVLFLVDPDRVDEIDRVFEVGGLDYITKPLRSYEILARVSHHLTIQRLTAELQIERLHRNKLINDARLDMMGKMAASVIKELDGPLRDIHLNLQNIVEKVQGFQGFADELESSLEQIGYMEKALTELSQIYKL